MTDEKPAPEEGDDDEIVAISMDDEYALELTRRDMRGAFSLTDFDRAFLGGSPSIPPAERRY